MKKLMLISLAFALGFISACSPVTENVAVQESLPELTLRIAGSQADCPAMEWAANEFNKANPNCNVVYEYLQGSYNEVLKERMFSPGDDRVDIFITAGNIQEGNELVGYAMDLMSRDDLDISQTFPSLIENCMYIELDGAKATKL